MEQNNSKALSISSLILGILGLMLTILCCCFIPFAGIFLAIPGLILGILGIRRHEGGMATAGTILSGIAIILSIVFLVFWLFALVVSPDFFNYNYWDYGNPYYWN